MFEASFYFPKFPSTHLSNTLQIFLFNFHNNHRGICTELTFKIGEGPSRDMYKGHKDEAKVGRFEGGRWGWMGQGAMEG